MGHMNRFLLRIVLLIRAASLANATELGIQDTGFTIDGKPAFLLGMS